MARAAKDPSATASGANGGVGFDPVGAVGDAVGGAGNAVGDAIGGVGDAIGGAVGSTLLEGFKAIIDLLFGGLQSAITVALIKWITTIPNLSGGHVGSLEASIAVGAAGLLAATMTISIVRFWGSGLTGDGAWAGAEGVARAAVAAVLIGLWPQIFSLAIRLANALQSGILGGGVQPQLKALFRDLDVIGVGTGAITGGAVPMFLAIVIAIVGILMLLALVAMKIVITALTIVLFCAMPLALVVWPIPELAGIARFCLRSLAVVMAIPVVWCLIFGSFAAIGADTFSFSNTGKDQGVFGTALNVTIVRPLVAIALLYMALVLPRRLLQLAPFMGGGGSGFGRALATGATLRAEFGYAPQAGGAALGRMQTAAAAAGSAKAGAAGGGGGGQPTPSQGAGANTAGNAQAPKTAPGGADKKAPSTPAASAKQATAGLRDQSSQAAKGGAEAGRGASQGDRAGEAAGDEAGPRTAASRPAQPGSGGGQAGSSTDQQKEQAMEKGEMFGGPRTMGRSADRLDAIAKQQNSMAADSGSGTGVSRGQVDAAVGDLQGRADLLGAARNAAFHGNAEQATGAFAEWSLTDNPHVDDQQRSAFDTLGRASPGQRRTALGAPEAGGQGPGSGEAGGRHVPAPGHRAPGPSAPRLPQGNPRRPGGS